jgi:mannose-6-phosphate isomerase-like protein (cupin superfamily)
MINIINIGNAVATTTAAGRARGILGPAETGTRVTVAIQDVDAGATYRLAPSDRTQLAYVLEGQNAFVMHASRLHTQDDELPRRAGVYLEPGEEAVITASDTPLVLLVVSVPKHTAKASDVAAPRGYVFVESDLRSLIDERAIRERTFWVNKETGLSGSWDMQIGRMAYAPNAYSPRHVHHASKTSPITPEHFYFIEKGTGVVKEDSGSRPVGPGDLVLIPAGEWHQLLASDSGFDYIEFQAPFDFMTTMDHDPQGKNWYIKGSDDGTGKPQRWVQS